LTCSITTIPTVEKNSRPKTASRAQQALSLAAFVVVIVPLAMLPSYEAWGNIAIGAPIVLRLLNGMFIGKKYTASLDVGYLIDKAVVFL
jgi:hypothetical protein